MSRPVNFWGATEIKLHEKIKYAREKMGWTIEQLAEHSGVKKSLLHKVEAGMEVLLFSEIVKIAKATYRTSEWLLSEEEPDDPECLHCKN